MRKSQAQMALKYYGANGYKSFKSVLFNFLIALAVVFNPCSFLLAEHKNASLMEKKIEIHQFSVISLDGGENLDSEIFRQEQWVIVYIMSKQCPVCDANLWWWDKIAREFGSSVKIFGIAMSNYSPERMLAMVSNKKLHFKIYYPVDRQGLCRAFCLEFEESRTLLLNGNHIHVLIPGELGVQDYFKIKKILKGEENEKNKKSFAKLNYVIGDSYVGGNGF